MLASVLFLVVGWGVVLILTPSVIRLGLGLDIKDEFRKKHDGKISRLGGVTLFVAFLVTYLGLHVAGSKIGTPLISGASVAAEIVAQDRAPKVVAFKKKRRKNTHRKRGHRQLLTRVKITDITGA